MKKEYDILKEMGCDEAQGYLLINRCRGIDLKKNICNLKGGTYVPP